jgi:hypothetical protein
MHGGGSGGDNLLYNECYSLRITFRVKVNAKIVKENASHAACLVFQRNLIHVSFAKIPSGHTFQQHRPPYQWHRGEPDDKVYSSFSHKALIHQHKRSAPRELRERSIADGSEVRVLADPDLIGKETVIYLPCAKPHAQGIQTVSR